MTVKEAIDVLERSCDFHYEETDKCYGCKFENSGWCDEDFHDSLLVLLKKQEQEPILLENQHKPYGISTDANSPWISRCPRCGKKVEGKQTRFCKYCGQAVKWE